MKGLRGGISEEIAEEVLEFPDDRSIEVCMESLGYMAKILKKIDAELSFLTSFTEESA